MLLSQFTEIAGVRVVRDGEFTSVGKAPHRKQGMLTFAEAEAPLQRALENPGVVAVIAAEALADQVPEGIALAVAPIPRLAFYALHEHLNAHTDFYWRDFPTEIHPTAQVDPRAVLSERSVRIGPRTVVEANAVVLDRTTLGADCIVRSGAVVGGRGFEFRMIDGAYVFVTHTGGVEIGDDVLISYHVTIDRAVYGGATRIGRGTKVDFHAQVSHNSTIGERCLIGNGSKTLGNVTIGNEVKLAPGAIVSNGLFIGDGAWISLGSVVTRDVGPGERVTGNFAVPHEKFIDFMRGFRG